MLLGINKPINPAECCEVYIPGHAFLCCLQFRLPSGDVVAVVSGIDGDWDGRASTDGSLDGIF